jgi:hypothetical protein
VRSYASVMDESLELGLMAFFLIFGLRQLLKQDWLAALGAALLFTMIGSQENWMGHAGRRGYLNFALRGPAVFSPSRRSGIDDQCGFLSQWRKSHLPGIGFDSGGRLAHATWPSKLSS